MSKTETRLPKVSSDFTKVVSMGSSNTSTLPGLGNDTPPDTSEVEKAIPRSPHTIQEKISTFDLNSINSFSTAVEKSLASSFVQEPLPYELSRSQSYEDSFLQDGHHSIDQLSGAAPPSEGVEPSMSPLHKYAFIFVACLAQFLSLAGMNQTVAPVMILASYFDIQDYGTLSWFSAAYSMTLGACILPAGKHLLFKAIGFLSYT